MKAGLLSLTLLASSLAAAQDVEQQRQVDDGGSWADSAHFFTGIRTGVAIPPGGDGLAPSVGLELGVAAPKGVGFGLHLLGMNNPPSVDALGIPKTKWGLGASVDVRFYFQTVEPLTLYPTLSLGFLGGVDAKTGKNVVLPMLNPGFGARVKVQNVYVAFEMGAASFYIPYVGVGVGWEMDKPPAKRAPVAAISPSSLTPPVASRPPCNDVGTPVPKPLIQQPVTQHPVTQEPVMQQPVTQQPAMQQPTTQQPEAAASSPQASADESASPTDAYDAWPAK